ncbi:hypothetical protein L210DRAFT_864571, partial [Boletus edulis BED1]
GWLRRWQVRDGREVGKVVNTAGLAYAVTASKNGRWILHDDEHVVVLRNATTNKEVFRVQGRGQTGWVVAVDVSTDSTKFALVSLDGILHIFSLSVTAGHWRLLPGPLQHGCGIAGGQVLHKRGIHRQYVGAGSRPDLGCLYS